MTQQDNIIYKVSTIVLTPLVYYTSPLTCCNILSTAQHSGLWHKTSPGLSGASMQHQLTGMCLHVDPSCPNKASWEKALEQIPGCVHVEDVLQTTVLELTD